MPTNRPPTASSVRSVELSTSKACALLTPAGRKSRHCKVDNEIKINAYDS
ncbi:hypothetical protein LguiA_012883 [Lonicera macranthoides]